MEGAHCPKCKRALICQYCIPGTSKRAHEQDGAMSQSPSKIRKTMVSPSPADKIDNLPGTSSKTDSDQDQSPGDSAFESNDSEEGEAEKIKREAGFCVMCESYVHLKLHWFTWHNKKNNFADDCYEIKMFDEIEMKILVSKGTNVDKELKACHICKEIFFVHRVDNHKCKNVKDCKHEEQIHQSGGYCLMCKFHFDDLLEHKNHSHMNNDSYEVREINGQSTLLPKGTNRDEELDKCDDCPRVTYSYRLHQLLHHL
ncbi:Hypothetical predicted protein [Cloeon dipterum]|uniref:Uncharacterized protein n=1 Tax=Cloeon dipterum TaxID=197152 RepID=A0A8S1DEA3_9INSE|nr:Hypothetical predicted protein [Cloeon dipterum]